MKLPTEKSHADYKEKEKKRKRRLYEQTDRQRDDKKRNQKC